eukprot:361464-Chlamydomonas_euryale.AAC.3
MSATRRASAPWAAGASRPASRATSRAACLAAAAAGPPASTPAQARRPRPARAASHAYTCAKVYELSRV